MKLGVKATSFAKNMRLIVDFTSIPNFGDMFVLTGCILMDNNEKETDIMNDYKLIQKGVYLIEKADVQKGMF